MLAGGLRERGMAGAGAEEQAGDGGGAGMDLLAGLMLGSLLGALVGLSTAPVVVGVVTALVALPVAFFGLSGGVGTLKAHASAARVVGFGAGMLAFLVLGVLARTHNWLQPGIGERVTVYEAARYPADVARELALYEHLGFRSGMLKELTPSNTPVGAGMLFSDSGGSECALLAAERFGQAGYRVQAMQRSPGEWKVVGDAASRLPAEQAAELMDAAWTLGCRGQ
jgi:hypothetical protein